MPLAPESSSGPVFLVGRLGSYSLSRTPPITGHDSPDAPTQLLAGPGNWVRSSGWPLPQRHHNTGRDWRGLGIWAQRSRLLFFGGAGDGTVYVCRGCIDHGAEPLRGRVARGWSHAVERRAGRLIGFLACGQARSQVHSGRMEDLDQAGSDGQSASCDLYLPGGWPVAFHHQDTDRTGAGGSRGKGFSCGSARLSDSKAASDRDRQAHSDCCAGRR